MKYIDISDGNKNIFLKSEIFKLRLGTFFDDLAAIAGVARRSSRSLSAAAPARRSPLAHRTLRVQITPQSKKSLRRRDFW